MKLRLVQFVIPLSLLCLLWLVSTGAAAKSRNLDAETSPR